MNLTQLPQPLLVGHRGYPARFPENTLASFEGAMQAGCDMIELDVTLTRDRQMVVIHDDTLDRTTSARVWSELTPWRQSHGWMPAAGLIHALHPSACRNYGK